MDNPEVIAKLQYYEEQIAILETQLNDTKEHLKKYTAPSNMKKYYENHKEEIKKKVKEYKERTNYTTPKDVIKERNKRAYQKKKDKIENKVKHLNTIDECNQNITIIRNIKNEAFLLLVREKVRADESFRIFINKANDTIKYLEHKENRIWQTNDRGML